MQKKLIIIGTILIAILLGWRLYYTFGTFHLKVVTPPNNKISQYTPSMTFVFSKPVDSTSVIATMNPDALSGAYTQGSNVVVNFNVLTPGQTYTVTLKQLQSTGGKKLKDQTVTFTANSLRFDQLSKEQQQAAQTQQNDATLPTTDKAYQYLPHSTLDYTLTITEQNGAIIINADLLLTGADARSGRDAAVAAYKKEADDYLASTGLDLSKYTITYTVIDPTT